MDRQLLRQKVRQKISVILKSRKKQKQNKKTKNTCDDITKIVNFGILIHVLS